jgi:site-specific recombinase XerD
VAPNRSVTMPAVRQGRPSAAEIEPRASIRWIKGRAYAELGAWAKWGGRRQEPLVATGEAVATRDPNTAAILFAQRLGELRNKRAAKPTGAPAAASDVPTSIGAFIGYHLAAKADVKGRRRPSEAEIGLQRTRLLHAAKFLRTKGIRDLREIDHAAVEAYMEHLQETPGARSTARSGGRRRESLDPSTQRKYLDALGNMLKRARSKGIIRTNFVEEMVDKPTADTSPTEHLEVWEAAILIEAARRLFPLSTPGLPIYPLLAWELLTGCIESEAKSREIMDLCLPGDREFPDGVVMVRTNQGRDKLKTAFRTRYLALQPQLAEIMGEYLRSARAPTGRLLFPGASPDEPIGDWRKALDEIAMVAGFEPGEVRTIRFRPTFATHRAYTCDEVGQPMSALKLRAEMGHGSMKMLEERYFKAARFRRPRPHLEYRWSDWADTYRDRLAAGIAAWLTPTLARTLSALAERPMASKEWAVQVGMADGTFYPARARLVQMELVVREGEGRGARWSLTEDGWATVRALGIPAQRRLAA